MTEHEPNHEHDDEESSTDATGAGGTLLPPSAPEPAGSGTVGLPVGSAAGSLDDSPKPQHKTVHSLRDKEIGYTLDPRQLPEQDVQLLDTLQAGAQALSGGDQAAADAGADKSKRTARDGVSATLPYEVSPDEKSRGSGTWGHLVIRSRNLARGVRERREPTDTADYELVRVLGQGAMGIVYQARQKSINRSVALKMLTARLAEDHKQREQFLAEAVVTGELAHPNIVPIYDLALNQQGELFYSMKQVQGTPWSARLASNRLAENLEIWMRVADAVAFAHARGVIHRDLKPENVMLGDFGEVLLMDWGIAVSKEMLSDPVVRMSSGMAGTPAYMAPEMAENGPLHRLRPTADIYLMGAILYEIVTGKPPHTGSDIWACLQAVVNNEIQPTDKEGELVDIALRAMAAKPEDRYPDMQQMQAAVREYQSHAESNTLVVRGDQELDAASKTGDYAHYQQAMVAFREALTLWPENRRAEVRLEEARIACAKRTLRTGDYDLGLSVLDPAKREHAPLVQQLRRRRRWRQGVRSLVFALIGIIVVGSVVAALWINRERTVALKNAERARLAELDAIANEKTANDNATKADEERKRAENNAREAERQAKLAKEQEARAREQEGIAVENAERAIRNEREAQQQRRIAQRQERIAAVRAEEAAAAAFRSKIGLAASQIEANMFNRAKSELSEIAARSGEEAWFQPPPWEFARLRYLLELSDLTIDTGGAVNCLAVSSDGRTVAVGGEGNRVLLYPLGETTPREIPLPLEHVTKLAFSRSGKRLVVACTGQSGEAGGRSSFTSELVVWDLDSHQAVGTRRPPTGHWVLDLHVHGPDDNLEIIAGMANMAAVPGELTKDVLQVWQPSNRVLVGHNSAVRAVALSADGNTLVSADDFGNAQIWQRTDDGGFRLLRERDQRVFMPNDGQTIHAVCFSPDDRLVATAGADGNIKLWSRDDLIAAAKNEDLQPARPVLAGHTAAVLDVDFSADGRLLVSTGEDATVRVWQVSDGRQTALLRGHSDAVPACAFSPLDPDRIVTGSADQDLRVWSLAGYREFLAIRSEAMPELLDARFAPDGRQVITAHRRGVFFGAAVLWPLTFDGDRPSLQATPPRILQEGHTLYVTRANVYRRGDKSELLTVAADGVGCLWDADQGRELLRVPGVLRRLNYGFPLAAMSSDGRWIVAVSEGRGSSSAPERECVSLWDRQQLAAAEAPPVARLTDPVESATAAAVSASGRWLFSGHQLGKGILWKRPDGGGQVEPGWTIESIGRPISAAWFSPDESRLFCVSEYVIRQFDVATGRELVQGRLAHAENVVSAAMNADGTRLIVASGDGSLTLWDLSRPESADSKKLATLATAQRNIQAVDITSDGAFVLDVGAIEDGERTEKTVRLSHVQPDGSLQEKSQMRFPGLEPESAAFYRDDASQIVVVGGYEAVLWDTSQPVPQRMRTFSAEGIPTAVRVSSDGRLVVTSHLDGAVKVWDAGSGRAVSRLQTPPGETVRFACFSPDDRFIFTADNGGQVSIWQVDSGEFVRQFCRHDSGQTIHQIAFSPDRTKLATASADGTSVVWDLQSGELLAELIGHQGDVLAVAFHPEQSWLATASSDQTARLWDLTTKEPLAVLRGHSKRVGAIGFSPDGRRLATGSADATAKIWAIRLAAVVPAEEAPPTPDVPTSAGAPQGEDDAAMEDLPPFATEVRVDEILTIKEHRDEITSVEFSTDGKNLLTGGRDGQAIVWPSSSTPAADGATNESTTGPAVP